jgi:RNA polymerase sigma-70 factor (ECF subfamily)
LTEKQAIYYELLILRYRQGQKDALEELVTIWEKPLFYYIHRLIEDEHEAWEILQETWIKVLQSIGKLREPNKLPVWLYSITRKTVMSHLRKKYSEKVLFEDNDDISKIENYNSNHTFENADQVHYGLSRISLPHRDILTLFFLRDLSIDDIAQVLSVPIGTVKSRLYYAREALKEILEKEVGDYE